MELICVSVSSSVKWDDNTYFMSLLIFKWEEVKEKGFLFYSMLFSGF